MVSIPERLGTLLSGSIVTYSVTMAKDTGIWQTLINANKPLTSQDIANAKGLKERYVREILASLGTAELLHMTSSNSGEIYYHLEESDKKAFNTSLYAFISFSKIFGSIYDEVKTCIKADGPRGVSYCDAVHEVIDEFSVYSTEANITSFLKHTENLREHLESGIQVIEFGSGKGRLLAMLASMFPKSTFTTSEYRQDLLEAQKQRWGHIPNICYQLMDLCALPDDSSGEYDWIFCSDVIHDLPKPLEALKGIRRLLKEKTGVFTFIDVATSGSPITDKGNINVASYYTAGTFLCIPESYQMPDSMALGPCWGRQAAIDLATSAGFVDVKDYNVENFQNLYVCKTV